MATHSSVLAWRIPGTGEPGGLPSMGSQSWTRLKRLSSSSNHYVAVTTTQLCHCNSNHVNKQVRLSPNETLFVKIDWEGKYVYLWLIHIDVWQKLTQSCKAIILQLKVNNFFKKRKKKTPTTGCGQDLQADCSLLTCQKRQRNQRLNCQHLLDHRKSKRVPEKHLFLLY